MIHLAFIWHMHQPYYKNLLTDEAELPWVRLHGIKDYADMVTILKDYPAIHQTFNVVPSLFEQVQAYADGVMSDRFMRLSRKKTINLLQEERLFIIAHFFMIDFNKIISRTPRYHELFVQAQEKRIFNDQDILDLVVWFNLAWFDPDYKNNIKELREAVAKGRFFTEEEKNRILDIQLEILKTIIPTYKEYQNKGQIEVSVTPYFHPILPLLVHSRIAKEANKKTHLPKKVFSCPRDSSYHIRAAAQFYRNTFGCAPYGMWPSEQAISKHVISPIMKNDFKWIVTDEELLFRTLPKKADRSKSLYRVYYARKFGRKLCVLFRDRNLSDMIGFSYQNWNAYDAVQDFMKHLQSINEHLKGADALVTIALDGENCWEYYENDGKDFLKLLYQNITESPFIKTVTVREYLEGRHQLKKLTEIPSGSWIYGDFLKWIGHPAKNKAWELLIDARKQLDRMLRPPELAWKQMYVLEGSDWFWWYGDQQRQFDELFRLHLKNFYAIIKKKPPSCIDEPLE